MFSKLSFYPKSGESLLLVFSALFGTLMTLFQAIHGAMLCLISLLKMC